MPQTELNEGFAKTVRKPGDPPLNPTGKQEPTPARLRRMDIKALLTQEMDRPCPVPGYEHMTSMDAMIMNRVVLAVTGVPWAVKEVNTRLFGRVPFQLAAAFSVSKNSDLSGLTMAELAERARAIAEATGIVDGTTVEAAPTGIVAPQRPPLVDGPAAIHASLGESLVAQLEEEEGL